VKTPIAARRTTDALLLAAALAVPLLGTVMNYDSAGPVWFGSFASAPLPNLCLSRNLGFRCPTCGVTRSVIALMHGDWRASLALHRFGWLILALIVAQVPYRLYRLAAPVGRAPRLERFGIASLAAVGAIVLVNRLAEAAGL
jgi:hypothetical protein